MLDVNGIGFELQVPLSTSSRLPEKEGVAELLVEMYITQAGIELFGFVSQKELDAFRMITSVKGVGPKAALNLLSRFEPEAIFDAIRRRDTRLIRSVPGIGEKKAAEILKSFALHNAPEPPADEKKFNPEIYQQAISALVSLGLSRKEARDRLDRLQYDPAVNLSELLKRALAQQR